MSRTGILILCQLLFSFAGGLPASIDGGSGVSRSATVGGLVLFLGVMFISIIIALVACLKGECWNPFRNFRRDGVAAAGIDNPLSDSGGVGIRMDLSEMDVRALEMEPIVFEPLPTLNDLTPGRNEGRPNGRHLGAIVPFSSPESHIYAHDWFDEPLRNFPRGNIQYIRELGKGWFGQVIEGEATDIVPYAKKMRVIIKVLRGDASDSEQMRFLDESRLYRDGNHGNILKLLGHSIETNPFLLLMEYCALGDLKSYLIANITRAEVLNTRGDILKMALDVAKGLQWMINSDFTHGDLAARNCQVGSEGRILIGDYGLSTQLFRDDYYWSGPLAIPLRWAAPETLHCTINTIQTLKVTKESNVWTFGVLLWEVTEFGKLPYFELNDEEVISRVLCEKNYVLGRPTLPSVLHREELHCLMSACWSPNPTKRPSISSIVDRLEFLIQTLPALPARDDFESKWESAPSQFKKKSVSFSGESPAADKVEPPVNFAISTPATPTVNITPFAKTQIDFERREDPFPSLDLWKLPDPEEEDYKERIERGEITQKVREKSESVQDLMILTHVEPGDLSDGESLVILDPTPPPLRRASSETALNSPSKASSHSCTTPKPTPFLYLPHNSIISTTPVNSPVNKTGIDIQLTAPTPSPGISINIIQPTPTPVENPNPPTMPTNKEDSLRRQILKRRFVFRDEDAMEGERKGARHTSTPIKSPSPLEETVSGDSVFDSPNANKDVPACQISPISQDAANHSIHSRRSSTSNSNTYTISAYGPRDDHGLELYQSVTSMVDSDQGDSQPSSSVSKKLNFDEEEHGEKGLDSWTQVRSEEFQPESWLVYTKVEGDKESEFNFTRKKENTIENIEKLNQRERPTSFKSLFRNGEVESKEESGAANAKVVCTLIIPDSEESGNSSETVKENAVEEEGLVSLTASRGTEDESLSPIEEQEPVPFVPSKWNAALNPAKSAIKSPDVTPGIRTTPAGNTPGIRKSVSFERKKRHLVYEYPPPPPPELEEEDHQMNPSGPIALSLDWDLDADEMEGVVEDDWDVEAAGESKTNNSNPMDVLYRISPFTGSGDEPTTEPPPPPPPTPPPGIGGLRHTREKLKLDLWKIGGEGSKSDSGVGSSTGPSPFTHCDN